MAALARPLMRSIAQTQSFLRLPTQMRASSASASLSTSGQLELPFLLPRTTTSTPSLSIPIFSNLSGLLAALWDSILQAVPKKKTSKAKAKSRRHAGKALKDVESLVNCSACGRIKRPHVLCPHCVANIQGMYNGNTKKV